MEEAVLIISVWVQTVTDTDAKHVPKKFPLQFFMKSAHSATCYSKIPAGIPLANGNLVPTVLCRHIKPIHVMLVSDIWDNETENGE